ncbi:Mitochondrial translocator assembly and maintenance protein 41 [Balamuthia mandrillaris]
MEEERKLVATMKDLIQREFPPVDFAVGYGSGFVLQSGYSPHQQKEVMMDLIFAVREPREWHEANVRRNREHYSFLASLGGQVVSFVQTGFGARIYYNPFVQVGEKRVKYGVIGMDDLLSDLRHWTTFYVSGRLQKPTKVLQENAEVEAANQQNLHNALRMALLLLPQQTVLTERQLYTTIASLSYIGDVRMGWAEHQRKAENIVTDRNMVAFRELYRRSLEEVEGVRCKFVEADSIMIEQEEGEEIRRRRMEALPLVLQKNIIANPEVLSCQQRTAQQLRSNLQAIITKSSRAQTFKGFLTAGFSKSMTYASQKLGKRWR